MHDEIIRIIRRLDTKERQVLLNYLDIRTTLEINKLLENGELTK